MQLSFLSLCRDVSVHNLFLVNFGQNLLHGQNSLAFKLKSEIFISNLNQLTY